MCSNGRQGGNGKTHQHQLKPVSEPHSSTRDNFGALKEATGITGPVKGKENNNQETSIVQEDKGPYI